MADRDGGCEFLLCGLKVSCRRTYCRAACDACRLEVSSSVVFTGMYHHCLVGKSAYVQVGCSDVNCYVRKRKCWQAKAVKERHVDCGICSTVCRKDGGGKTQSQLSRSLRGGGSGQNRLRGEGRTVS